jgi:hypothetical protein
MQDQRKDERIEKHPLGDRKETDVQVLKLPLNLPGGPSRAIGVKGFYWDVGRGVQEKLAEIRRRKEELCLPWRVLEEIKQPVYMKDDQLRFIYANKACIDDLAATIKELASADVKSVHSVLSLDDLIGRKARDLFPEQIAAKEFEIDDGLVVTGQEPKRRADSAKRGSTMAGDMDWFEKRQLHRDKWVRIVRTQIRFPNSRFGMLGMFWFESDVHSVNMRIDWRPATPRLYIRNESLAVDRSEPWFLFDILLQNLGRYVPYAVIAKSGLIIDEAKIDERKGREALHQVKKRLKERLSEIQPKLGISFKITPRSHAYKMTLEEN